MTMANITLTSAKRDAILRGLEAKRRPIHWTAGKILLAAVLAAVLTVSAFAAVSPMIREALANALGSFLAQSQPITGVAVEQDGIEIRVVSALSDSGMTRIYCEVQDKTGDRLGPNMQIGAMIEGLPWEPDSTMIGTTLIAYDKETRTALVELRGSGGSSENDFPATIKFKAFKPIEDLKDSSVRVPIEAVTEKTLTTMLTEDGKTVLQPNQTELKLEKTEQLRFSSVGFGSDNRLHVQVAFMGAANRNDSYVLTNARSRSGREDMLYNEDADFISFCQDGIWYEDMAFHVTPSDLEDLVFDDLYGSLYVKPALEGEWNVDVTIEHTPTLTYETNVQVGGALVKKVNLSAISVFVISDSERTVLGHRPTYAMLRDGTKLILTSNCVSSMWALDTETNQGHAYDQWTFNEPLDPAEVVSMNFDGVTVPLQ